MDIILKYSCSTCGLKDIQVRVIARENEEVKEWLNNTVLYYIYPDHLRRSPDCQATSLQDLKIPLTGTDKIGGPIVQ